MGFIVNDQYLIKCSKINFKKYEANRLTQKRVLAD